MYHSELTPVMGPSLFLISPLPIKAISCLKHVRHKLAPPSLGLKLDLVPLLHLVQLAHTRDKVHFGERDEFGLFEEFPSGVAADKDGQGCLLASSSVHDYDNDCEQYV